MRAATGIQLLPDGLEGTEQRPAFRIKHDDIHHTAGVQRVGFDIVGRVIRGLVTLAPLRAAGLRDVIRRTAAHIHLNRIEGFTGHGVFALKHGRNCLHLFDLGNRQIFIQHILPNNTATTVSRVSQVLRIFIRQATQGHLRIHLMLGFDITRRKFRGGAATGSDNLTGNNRRNVQRHVYQSRNL
ncbi:hypothetical protein ExPECSC016_00949 [Escherichia coli]|nr:hypothetical protein ExPECSC016_00949 [Escherichia coli]